MTAADALKEAIRASEHDGCERCWYCSAPLAKRHEHDHVMTRRHGSDFVVPACMGCHELKDRTPLHEWDATEVVRFIVSIPAGPQRVLWAKLVNLGMDLEAMAPHSTKASHL